MDDDSMSSTTNYTSQSLSSRPENSTEESSWTMYFEDFIANNNDQQHTYYSFSCSQHQNSSMASDASFRKVDNNKFVSKNRKFTAKIFVDEELEDTASSPSHSPKVNDLNRLYMTSKELGAQHTNQVNRSYSLQQEKTKDKYIQSFQVKGQSLQHAGESIINMGFLETQLRRKGLCLVPISRLTNNLT